ncbi:hypothetical protein EVAR_64338_1 [Eumeta japonica]|uniref:Uncharacterized protein n=1 Tax=Eumeta variegata TaxID=151549 RepID=A0A4C1ZPT7_EUMVA|nr:hypothetical protein EVAR_64338_1 [Eumeta japonica]
MIEGRRRRSSGRNGDFAGFECYGALGAESARPTNDCNARAPRAPTLQVLAKRLETYRLALTVVAVARTREDGMCGFEGGLSRHWFRGRGARLYTPAGAGAGLGGAPACPPSGDDKRPPPVTSPPPPHSTPAAP